MYQSTVFPSSLPLALCLIGSTILHPQLLPTEIEAQKAAAAYEIREIWAKPELILPEIFHTVAFRDNTLGMPLLCPDSQLGVLGEKEVRGFMRDWFSPGRMVVAGVGMGHEELVKLADQQFGSMDSAVPVIDPIPTLHRGSRLPVGSKSFATVSNSPLGDAMEEYERLRNAKAVYTGGEKYIPKEDEEFVHLHVGFEGLGIHDPDIARLLFLHNGYLLIGCSMPLRRYKPYSEAEARSQQVCPVLLYRTAVFHFFEIQILALTL